MKYLFVVFSLALNCSLAQSGLNTASIVGFWETSDKDTIEIVNELEICTGYLRGFELPDGIKKEWVIDENNEKESLRSRPLDGIKIFENMKYNSELWEGKIYLPEEGKKLNCTLELMDKNLIEITVKVFFLSETDKLKRIIKK